MALIKCPECGKEVSSHANACPYCGCPVSEVVAQQQDSPEEWYKLGQKYYSGEGVQKDIEKAVSYFTQAAKLGFAVAQCRLGDIYADEFFTTYSEDRREQIIEELVFDFCSVLKNRIASDGEIEVRLISADLETGLFQIGVTEEYTYPFGGMNGKCYYEKAYSFN